MVGGIAWRDCVAGLRGWRDCVVGGIACWRDCVLAGLPTSIARRRIAGLQAVGCQDCLRVGLPTGGIAACGIACRIACVGLRVCRRL